MPPSSTRLEPQPPAWCGWRSESGPFWRPVEGQQSGCRSRRARNCCSTRRCISFFFLGRRRKMFPGAHRLYGSPNISRLKSCGCSPYGVRPSGSAGRSHAHRKIKAQSFIHVALRLLQATLSVAKVARGQLAYVSVAASGSATNDRPTANTKRAIKLVKRPILLFCNSAI